MVPRFVFKQARIDRKKEKLRHHEFDVGLAGGWPVFQKSFILTVGIDLGLVFFKQKVIWVKPKESPTTDPNYDYWQYDHMSSEPPQGTVSLGIESHVWLEVGYQLPFNFCIVLKGTGGSAIFSQSSRTKIQPVFGSYLTLAYTIH